MDHHLDELLKPDVGDVTLTTDAGRTITGQLGYEISDVDGGWYWYVDTHNGTRYHFVEEDVLTVDHDASTIHTRA